MSWERPPSDLAASAPRLVPPPYRAEPGAFAARRLRCRERIASARPQPAIEQLPGEEVLARVTADDVQAGRAINGRIYLTDRKLIFVPDSVGVAGGDVPSLIPWSDISGAAVAPCGTAFTGGSIRRRPRVTTAAGQAEYYQVMRPAEAVRLIEQARLGLQGPPC
jgi:hypothetical protein